MSNFRSFISIGLYMYFWTTKLNTFRPLDYVCLRSRFSPKALFVYRLGRLAASFRMAYVFVSFRAIALLDSLGTFV